MGERNVIQTGLMIEYRYMQSKKEGSMDIGPKRAEEEFIGKFASKFAEVYDKNNGSNLSYDEIYSRIFGVPKVHETHST